MEAVAETAERIVHHRRLITPRTSYATGGKAAEEIVVLISNDSFNDYVKIPLFPERYRYISSCLIESKEFQTVLLRDSDDSRSFTIDGHVILAFFPDSIVMAKLVDLIIQNKTKLVFGLFLEDQSHYLNSLEQFQQLCGDAINLIQEKIESSNLYIFSKNNQNQLKDLTRLSSKQLIGNWGHPTVISRQQFRYLWIDKTAWEGKYRLLQRLANHQLKRGEKVYKLKANYFDTLIQKTLQSSPKIDDYDIYNLLRQIYLCSSLINTTNTTITGGDSNNHNGSNTSSLSSLQSTTTIYQVAPQDLIPDKPWGVEEQGGGEGGGDGRSKIMVDMTKDCIPTTLLTGSSATNNSSGSSSSRDTSHNVDSNSSASVNNGSYRSSSVTTTTNTGIRTILDYGCAEGAITAQLCKELHIPPSHCIGADVRKIPSEGFTFMLLPSESTDDSSGDSGDTNDDHNNDVIRSSQNKNSHGNKMSQTTASQQSTTTTVPGSILPAIANNSIDLITSAMVFHHVRHVKSVMSELRRVISQTGALIIREHDCISASEAVFLDITHGLYSLVLSEPIEWPAFINEYQAWYHSREDWNNLLHTAGFQRLERGSARSEQRYNAAVNTGTLLKKAGSFQNAVSQNVKLPNVIKAYYAVYIPDTNYKVPHYTVPSTIQQLPMTTTRSSAASIYANNINPSHDHTASNPIAKRQKVDTDNTSNSSGSNSAALIAGSVSPSNSISNSISNSATSSATAVTSTGWVVYESSKYRGSYYIIDPITQKTHWITAPLTLTHTAITDTTTSTTGSSAMSGVSGSVGSFLNPVTKSTCLIKRIEYAPATINKSTS